MYYWLEGKYSQGGIWCLRNSNVTKVSYCKGSMAFSKYNFCQSINNGEEKTGRLLSEMMLFFLLTGYDCHVYECSRLS